MKKLDRQRRDEDFCKQYVTADWDGCEAVEYFAMFQEPDPETKHASKSNIELYINLRDIHIAEVHAYNMVIPAYVKHEVVSRLEKCLAEPITAPETVSNPETYRNAFTSQVKEILRRINSNDYPFQKRKNVT